MGIESINAVLQEVKKVVIGKDEIIKKVMIAILADGHILIEDIPGVGKTTLALAFSKAMSLHHNRMQFTPDVMPSDVTGFSMYNKNTNTFEYREGAIMCNLFLADEINRTSSKTQAALLEGMEEGRVTVDGVTREIPKPFTVIATQNPIGSVGTQMLPESQLDRFIMKLTMGYPSVPNEVMMLKGKHNNVPLESVNPIMDAKELKDVKDKVEKIFIHDDIYEYIATIMSHTRRHASIQLGASPRGSVAAANVAKAVAYLDGRNYVVPDDVKEMLLDTIRHRILLSPKAKVNKMTVDQILNDILRKVEIKK